MVIIALLYLITFYNRYIQIDENFFAEQGYWLLNEGNVKIKSIPGVLNWNTQFFVYHKLLVWISSGIIYVFGWSIFNLKTFTLVVLILFLFLLWKYLREQGVGLAWMAIFIFISIPYILIKSFEFRPEVLMMLFTFSSFVYIDKSFKTNKYQSLLIAGVLAGIAFLVHLNAVIACVAGALTLLFRKDIKGTVVFSAAAIPICLIYFYPLIVNQQLDAWFFELKNWPTHNFDESVSQGFLGTVSNIASKLANEQKRFFWDEKVMIVSAIFFLSLLFSFKRLWANHKNLIIYLGLLVISMAILGSHVAPRYLLMYLPFMVITIVLAFTYSNKWFNYLFYALSFAQLVVLANTGIDIVARNKAYASESRDLVSQISESRTSIIGPWEIIFDEIGNHDIYNFKTYEYQEDKMSAQYTQMEVLEDLYNREVEFIVLDELMKNDKIYHWFHNWKIQQNSYYQEFNRDDDYLILKRI